MRTDVPAPPTYGTRKRSAGVTVYPITVTPRDLLNGTAVGGVAWTSYVSRATVTDTGATLEVVLPRSVSPPAPGQCVRIWDDWPATNTTVFNGVVESWEDAEEVGTLAGTLTLRRRDAGPLWREVRRISDRFAAGSDLGLIADKVASYELQTDERSFGQIGIHTAQDAIQLSDMTLWDMLRAILQPALREPFIDARGFAKWISRDVRRKPDIVIPSGAFVKKGRTTARAGITIMRVKYLDPVLREYVQPTRMLAATEIPISLFHQEASKEVWWSQGHTQRAKNTYLRVKKSINGQIQPSLTLKEETFRPFADQTGGTIDVSVNHVDVGTLGSLTRDVAGAIADIIGAFGGLFSGDPSGFEKAFGHIMDLIRSQGVGEYEVWGQPFEFIHATNLAEAYDYNAPAWHRRIEEIESQFIPNEATARALAVGELVFRSKASANGGEITIGEDYRVEPGDLIQLPPDDGRVFAVQKTTRQVVKPDDGSGGSGGEAVATCGGFFL